MESKKNMKATDNFIENDDLDTSFYNADENAFDDFRLIRVTKRDFSLYELFRKFKANKLFLDVDFQRRDVWKPIQNIELIESILMGLPLPIFYFKQQEQATYITVDGKQRLSAIFNFMEGKFRLQGLKIMRHLDGISFPELTSQYGIYQSQLEDYQIYAHVILPPTPDRVLFNIFDRVNRGGTPLNKQEIRNSLYRGIALETIDSITKTKEFIDATKIKPERDKRMKGAYLLTRFFAFLLLREEKLFSDEKPYIYRGDVDDLLAKSLQQLNREETIYFNELFDVTIGCLHEAKSAFGNGVFRIAGNASRPINMNIFEITLYFVYKLRKQEIPLTTDVGDAFKKVCNSNEFLKFIDRGGATPEYVKGRFDLIDGLLFDLMR